MRLRRPVVIAATAVLVLLTAGCGVVAALTGAPAAEVAKRAEVKAGA